jgi:hypothetical protein
MVVQEVQCSIAVASDARSSIQDFQEGNSPGLRQSRGSSSYNKWRRPEGGSDKYYKQYASESGSREE